GQPALGILEQLVLVRVTVDRARHRLAEARQVRAAVAVLDRVRETGDELRVPVVPLHRDVDGDALVLAGERDDVAHDRLVRVEIAHVRRDAAAELERAALVVALVAQHDLETAVEVRELAELLRQLVVRELEDVLEDLRIGMERDLRAVAIRGVGEAGLLELARRLSLRVLLMVNLAVPPDLELEPIGGRVDRRYADAVQATGHLVASAAELAAGVQHRHHDLGRGALLAGVHVDWNAAAIILDGHRVVVVNDDVDACAVSGEVLVDGVVDNFVDEMMQAGAVIGVADVHAGPLAHALEAFEHSDRAGVVRFRDGTLCAYCRIRHPETTPVVAFK